MQRAFRKAVQTARTMPGVIVLFILQEDSEPPDCIEHPTYANARIIAIDDTVEQDPDEPPTLKVTEVEQPIMRPDPTGNVFPDGAFGIAIRWEGELVFLWASCGVADLECSDSEDTEEVGL